MRLKKPLTGQATDLVAAEGSPGMETSQGHLPKAQKGSAAVTSQCLQPRALTEAFFLPFSHPAPTAAPAASPLLVLLPGSSWCCSCLSSSPSPPSGCCCSRFFLDSFPARCCRWPCLQRQQPRLGPAGLELTPRRRALAARVRATHPTPAVNGNNHRKFYWGLGDLRKLKVRVITVYFTTNDEYWIDNELTKDGRARYKYVFWCLRAPKI